MHDKDLHAAGSSKINEKRKSVNEIKTAMDVESREMKPTVNILNVVNIKNTFNNNSNGLNRNSTMGKSKEHQSSRAAPY